LPQNTEEIQGDLVLATYWTTAYALKSLQNFRKRLYLIQDFEPFFYSMGSEYILAENTYKFGFHPITSSMWLQQNLRNNYGCLADYVPYAVEKNIFNEKKVSHRSEKQIAFYSRFQTTRRAVELGILALELVFKEMPEIEVVFFGSSMGQIEVPFRYSERGILTEYELADLYRESSIGVVFSTTNHSLVPLEMMACGLPVVELNSASTALDFPRNVARFCEPEPYAIAKEIICLLTDEALRNNLSQSARNYIMPLDWMASARRMENAFVRCVQRSE
jgi:glycosyltransferase involved in cell wall biosynthesis